MVDKCIVCGNEYCMLCEAIIPCIVHRANICKDCGRNENVGVILLKHAKIISTTIDNRDEELKIYGKQNQRID